MTDGPPSWRELLQEGARRLRSHGIESPAVEARRFVEEASGWEGADHGLHLNDPSTVLTATAFFEMLDRRERGEPLQYVLGRWGFRTLDLYVDRRVLIPRPETEEVVGAALQEVDRLAGSGRRLTAIDLGTGSGAIGLSLAVERPIVDVWASDRSDDALAVARANLAGIGHAGTRVRLVPGAWWSALPDDLRGRVDVIVSNPPYVAASEVPDLPLDVARWEPVDALVSGPTGLEAIGTIVSGAPPWLVRSGALVVEHAPHHAAAVATLAHEAGFAEVETRRDLSGRERMLIARTG